MHSPTTVSYSPNHRTLQHHLAIPLEPQTSLHELSNEPFAMLHQILDLPLDVIRRVPALMSWLQETPARTSNTTTVTLTTTTTSGTALNEVLDLTTTPAALSRSHERTAYKCQCMPKRRWRNLNETLLRWEFTLKHHPE
jgi:hypothetical protein